MKLGLIARMDSGGLAAQTWELYKALKPTKTLVIDLKEHNGYPQYPERFPDGEFSISFPTNPRVDQFLEGLDIVLTVETPYTYYLLDKARQMGIKTVVQYNYEFLDYLQNPQWIKPDMLLAPSVWYKDEVEAKAKEWGCEWDYLPVPVNRKLFPYYRKKQAKTFLHIAGHSTYEDRNGTEIVYAAIPLVKSDVKFVIRSQYQLPQFESDFRVNVNSRDAQNYWEVYNKEDVLLLPRRYGGLSLQLNEAMSSGMIPLMSNVSPQNTFLHPGSLIEAEKTLTIMTRTNIDVYSVTPEALAARIDELANADEDYITMLSEYSDTYAESISWDNLLPEYERVLEKCLKS